MTMNRWDGDSDVALSVAERWDGAQWVALTVAERWDGTQWVAIALPGGGGGSTGSLRASVTPGSAVGVAISTGPTYPTFRTVTSNSVTVTPAGGNDPYTYAWSKQHGDSAVLPTDTSAATTSFYGNVAKNMTIEATYQCVITDANDDTHTIYVPVTLSHETDA